MRAEPVVWKHSIWGAVGQSMLKKVDLNAGALQQRQCHIDQGVFLSQEMLQLQLQNAASVTASVHNNQQPC